MRGTRHRFQERKTLGGSRIGGGGFNVQGRGPSRGGAVTQTSAGRPGVHARLPSAFRTAPPPTFESEGAPVSPSAPPLLPRSTPYAPLASQSPLPQLGPNAVSHRDVGVWPRTCPFRGRASTGKHLAWEHGPSVALGIGLHLGLVDAPGAHSVAAQKGVDAWATSVLRQAIMGPKITTRVRDKQGT